MNRTKQNRKKKSWDLVKEEMKYAIKNNPDCEFVKMIDRGNQVILIDRQGREHFLSISALTEKR